MVLTGLIGRQSCNRFSPLGVQCNTVLLDQPQDVPPDEVPVFLPQLNQTGTHSKTGRPKKVYAPGERLVKLMNKKLCTARDQQKNTIKSPNTKNPKLDKDDIKKIRLSMSRLLDTF